MPLVISDASTLIHLAGIGRLALLKEIYEKIVIPAAVWAEVVEQGRGRSGAMEVEVARQAGWIEVLSPTNEPLVLDTLRSRAGFWIAEELYQQVLRVVGEMD